MIRAALAVLSWALASAGPGAAPRVQAAAPPAALHEIELQPYVAGLFTLNVRSGAWQAPFLLDTGGGGTVVSPGVAKALGLEPFGRGTGFRHDGTRVDGERAGPVELALGGFVRRGEVGVLDLEPYLGGLPPVGGILALDCFAGQALTVDLAHRRLFVETTQSFAARHAAATELDLRVAHQAAGAGLDVFVALEGLHGPLWFELDCGNTGPVLIAPHAFRELDQEVPGVGATLELELPVLGLGLVRCGVQCKELIYDGLLNAEFFARHVIGLDLGRGRAWARPND